MSAEQIYQDYYDAHGGRLGDLAGHAERLIESGYPGATVVQSPEYPDGALLSGGLSILDAYAYAETFGIQLTSDEAAKAFVDRYEAQELAEAQMSFIFLRATAEMHLAITGDPWMADGLPSEQVPYTRAERHIIMPDGDLEVEVVKLRGVWHLGDVTQYTLDAHERPVTTSLKLLVINDRVTYIRTDIQPSSDESFRRWEEILGLAMADFRFRRLLAGNFDTVEELDTALTAIQQRFTGSAQEHVVGPVLAEIRIRAIAAREAKELSVLQDPSLSLPSVDRLDEWLGRLSMH